MRLGNWLPPQQVLFTSHSLANTKDYLVIALHYSQSKRSVKRDVHRSAGDNPCSTQQQQLALTPPVQQSLQHNERAGRKAGCRALAPMLPSLRKDGPTAREGLSTSLPPRECDSPSSLGPGLTRGRVEGGQPAGQDKSPHGSHAPPSSVRAPAHTPVVQAQELAPSTDLLATLLPAAARRLLKDLGLVLALLLLLLLLRGRRGSHRRRH